MRSLPVIPSRMRALERDPRGYPIPWSVWRDNANHAHFTINDEIKRFRSLVEDLCAICGGKLMRNRWFVGGPGSAFDPNGAYFDPPMHGECAHFALKACPYLAAPHYTKRIDAGTVDFSNVSPDQIFLDRTQSPERPAQFVAVLAIGQTLYRPQYLVRPTRPYLRVEYWKNGERLRKGVNQ